MDKEIKEIRIESLQPFKMHSGQTYEGERLQQMMDSINRLGLLHPITVRFVENGKYEIICGHNRTKAMKALGYDVIMADIRYEMSDEEAIELFYDSNLNQQTFSDWSYSQKIKAIQYAEKIIKKDSQQGKRNDLEQKKVERDENGTCVQTRHKLKENTKRVTARDKMAHRLGTSTATLSKYRRIIKLSDDLVEAIARLLDERKITFEAAYIISNMREVDIRILIDGINKYPDSKLDLSILKELPTRSDEAKSDVLYPKSPKRVLEALKR